VLIYTCQHHPAPATRSRSLVSQSIITALFRRFVGRQTNYPPQTARALDPTAAYHERAKRLEYSAHGHDMTDRQPSPTGKSQLVTHRHSYCFAALTALEWLCDFSSVVGREEAAEMAAQPHHHGSAVCSFWPHYPCQRQAQEQ
jgi:GTPase-activating protein SST2